MSPELQAVDGIAIVIGIFAEYFGVVFFIFSMASMIYGYSSGNPALAAKADKRFRIAITSLVVSMGCIFISESIYQIADNIFKDVASSDITITTEISIPKVEDYESASTKEPENVTPMVRDNSFLSLK